MRKQIIFAIVFLIFAAQSFAVKSKGFDSESQYYIGYSIVNSDYSDGNVSVSGSDTGFKIFGGLELTKNFGVEAGYMGFGDFSGNYQTALIGPATANVSTDVYAFFLAGVGQYDLSNKISFVGKLGIVRWIATNDLTITENTGGFSIKSTTESNGFDFMYSMGVKYNLYDNLGLSFDAASYNINDNDDFTFTFGMRYNFGF